MAFGLVVAAQAFAGAALAAEIPPPRDIGAPPAQYAQNVQYASLPAALSDDQLDDVFAGRRPRVTWFSSNSGGGSLTNIADNIFVGTQGVCDFLCIGALTFNIYF
jgi:hypothetical protein